MRWLDILRISVRMVWSNLLRSLLTMLGISVAIGLIVFLVGLGYGLQEITIGAILHSDNLLSLDISSSGDNPLPITPQTVKEIKAVPGMRGASPVAQPNGQVGLAGNAVVVALTVVDRSYFDMAGLELDKGRLFTDGALEVVISPITAASLGSSSDGLLNKTVSLSYTDSATPDRTVSYPAVKVVGITKEDVPTAYFPFAQAQGLLSIASVKGIAADQGSLAGVQSALQAKGYQVNTLSDTLDQARAIFRWFTWGLAVFGLIAMSVAGIGMFNTLTISLLQRTREYGIMKTLGVTDESIRRLFLVEAAMIGLLGGAIGVGMALLLEWAVNFFMDKVSVRYGGAPLQLFAHPTGFLAAMVLFPVVLAIVTALYPAIRASRINPLAALRYE